MKRLITIMLLIAIAVMGGAFMAWSHFGNKAMPKGPIYYEEVTGIKYDYDVHYQKGKNNCYMDIAYEDNGEKKPLLILVHGGAWVTGDKESLNNFFYTFSGRDYVVANVNYDLISFDKDKLGKVTVVSQEENILEAINYLYNNADKYGIDTDRVYIAGHSAGGQLIGHIIEKEPDLIHGAILISAATDFRYFMYHSDFEREFEVSLVLIPFFFDGKVDSDIITEINKVDVITNVTTDMPKTLIIHGDYDNTLPYVISKNLYEKMKDAGCKVDLQIIHNMEHNPEIEEVADIMDQFFQDLRGENNK